MVAPSIIACSMSPTSFPVARKVRKPGPLSVRNVALTAVLPLSLLCAGRAEALSTITQTISNTTLAPFNTLGFGRTSPRSSTSILFQDFQKFDTALGTLHKIRFEGNGDLVGSFRGAKSSNNTPASTLTGGTATLKIDFTVAGWSTTNTGGATPFIGASSLATATATNLANGSGGTLLTSSDPLLNLTGEDTGTYFSAFEGSAGDIITATFTWGVQLTSNNLTSSGACSTTVKCTGFNFNPTGLATGQQALTGDINSFKLFYDYKPFPPAVPAPLPILGSGVAFAYTRRLRRRIQKAQFTL